MDTEDNRLDSITLPNLAIVAHVRGLLFRDRQFAEPQVER